MSTDGVQQHDQQGDPPGDSEAAIGTPDRSPAEQPAPADAPHRNRALRRVLIGVGVLGLVLALLIGGGVWFLTERYAGNLHRVGNVFAGLDQAQRPAPAAPAQPEGAAPVTFLLIGSDTRADLSPGALPNSRSDLMMLVRFTGDRKHAQVISIPRDSWVNIPGHGMNKLNAAYAFGGPTLLIQTIEQLTGVRIDHFGAVGFQDLINITDKLGGVDVHVAQTSSWGGYTFPAGVDHLNGTQARWYVGQRYGLPGGDFDRERRQQEYLRAMFTKLFSQSLFTDPGKLDSVLRAVASDVAVDSELGNTELLGLAYSMRGLTPQNVEFFTAPVLGTGREGAASVVYLDAVKDARMWGYLKTDSLGQNAAEFSNQQLPAVPN